MPTDAIEKQVWDLRKDHDHLADKFREHEVDAADDKHTLIAHDRFIERIRGAVWLATVTGGLNVLGIIAILYKLFKG